MIHLDKEQFEAQGAKNWKPKLLTGGVALLGLARKNSSVRYGRRLLAKRLAAKSEDISADPVPVTDHALTAVSSEELLLERKASGEVVVASALQQEV